MKRYYGHVRFWLGDYYNQATLCYCVALLMFFVAIALLASSPT